MKRGRRTVETLRLLPSQIGQEPNWRLSVSSEHGPRRLFCDMRGLTAPATSNCVVQNSASFEKGLMCLSENQDDSLGR